MELSCLHLLARESLVEYTDIAKAGLKLANALANESEMLARLSLANTNRMASKGRARSGLSATMAESFQKTIEPDQMSASVFMSSTCVSPGHTCVSLLSLLTGV